MLKIILGAVVGAGVGYGLVRYARAKDDDCYLANYKKIPGTEMTLPGTPTPDQVGATCRQQNALSFLSDNSPMMTAGGFAVFGALAGYALK